MKRAVQFLIFVIAGAGLFLFFSINNSVTIPDASKTASEQLVVSEKPKEVETEVNQYGDIPPQKPLANPPEIIKAVYATGWTAGGIKGLNRMIDLIKITELNAIIIDIKDYSGELSYQTDIEEVERYGKDRDLKILRPNAMIKKLHDEGIYVIARQTVFQDPVLAKARPDLALTSSSTGKQWLDNKKVMWIDPASKEAWDYNIAIAKDVLARGFDELNFDYIRFASDGKVDDIIYPFWDGKTFKRYVIRDFWKYLRKALPDDKISADLFGLATLNYGDMGIGQNIDDAFHYFDVIAPMLYPSHYHEGFNGYQTPASKPYEVVLASMLEAEDRLDAYILNAANSTSTEKYLVKKPQLRPWLQDFDLGADYDAAKVRAQIMATYAASGYCQKVATTTDSSGFSCDPAKENLIGGWMLWDPSNVYTKAALLSE